MSTHNLADGVQNSQDLANNNYIINWYTVHSKVKLLNVSCLKTSQTKSQLSK